MLAPHYRSRLFRFPVRALNLHEYQAKELLDRFGVATQVGYTACTPAEAKQGTRKMLGQGIGTVVLKAQVFAGGRGKGTLSSGLKGGVQFTKSPEESEHLSSQMLGFHLRTHQTPPEGLLVRKLLLAEGVDIAKELYLAVILDRSKGGPVIVASREGGVEIEETADKNPEAIGVVPIDIQKGITPNNIEAVANILLPDAKTVLNDLKIEQDDKVYDNLKQQLKDLVQKLYTLFVTTDASQIEINPLAITKDQRVLCVDAKLNFDDNAAYRQKDLFAQEDTSVRDPRELAAEEAHMNFIAMDGNIGCLVNGAGLAMATMDLIASNGGSPANFLDLGGGASKSQVKKSFQLLTSDPKVKAIFVNIFGGITRCDVVAQGMLEAAQELHMNVPLIIRLVGNNAERAREIINSPELKNTGLNVVYVQDFAQAARTACELAK